MNLFQGHDGEWLIKLLIFIRLKRQQPINFHVKGQSDKHLVVIRYLQVSVIITFVPP